MSDGAILELVSRGKKDAYQNQDATRTWFGSSYERRSPSTREIKLLFPKNQVRFGKFFDIDIPADGDVLTSFELRITMPTWLPADVAAKNPQITAFKVTVDSQPYQVLADQYIPPSTDPSANPIPFVYPPTPLQYGWCDGISNYIIQKWTLFADNNALITGFGEFNKWFSDLETSHNIAPVIHASTGSINRQKPGSIQANATLSELVFRVPIPGCQRQSDTGLPIAAFRNQRLYVRFWLLDKSALVESTAFPNLEPPPTIAGFQTLPMYEISPAPWGGRQVYVNDRQAGKTLAARDMGHPYIYARCSILNVDNELRKSLQIQKYEIRFHQQLRDDWTVEDAAFIPGSNYRRLLTINGLFQTLYVGFRSTARTLQNKYSDVMPGIGDWLSEISLNVNGQDRILSWDPKKLKTLANNTQFNRDINIALYYLVFGISPDSEPGGACNLSRCQKAVLNATFTDIPIDPMTGSRVTYGFVFGEAWNILDIENGLAKVRFAY